MSKDKEIVGIDVSKLKLDVYSRSKGHQSFSNDLKGFKTLLKCYGQTSWYVMEATGCYHQQLGLYLHSQGVSLSVVNPLIIKRYCQMSLSHLKTDKHDAKMISHYGDSQPLKLWKPPLAYQQRCKRYQVAISLYLKQRTALSNMLSSLASSGVLKGELVTSLKLQHKRFTAEIIKLETLLEETLKQYEGELYKNLRSIPGVGKKTAMLLLLYTNGFKDFESPKQLISYFGLAPTERSSGSSIRGRSYITKTGDGTLRNHLFMCSFTACVHNKGCKALYDRLVAKGKSKKLALIAVCNKLLKQAYGIAKSGMPYDENYKRILV